MYVWNNDMIIILAQKIKSKNVLSLLFCVGPIHLIDSTCTPLMDVIYIFVDGYLKFLFNNNT